MTVPTDWLTDYERHLREDYPASTAGTYGEILRRADRQLPAGLALAHLDELKDWLNTDRRSEATRHLRRSALGNFFGWACDPLRVHRLDFNPAELLPVIKVVNELPKPIPDVRLREVLLCAAEPYRSWFLLCALAGLRCMELSALDRQHIGADRIWVQGKGRRQRWVPTHPRLWELAQRLPVGPVTVGPDGGRLDRRQVSRAGNYQLQQVLGHRDLHMHLLRHTFGTNAYEASGCDIRATQTLLGHASVATTQRYVAPSSDHMRAAVAGLPDVA